VVVYEQHEDIDRDLLLLWTFFVWVINKRY